LLLSGATLATRAHAAETPVPVAQATADHGEFLPFARPPAAPVGVCLVDTGVDLNPDIRSAVICRETIGGGPGGDADPAKHGTLMAMMMAAAYGNNWAWSEPPPTRSGSFP
jgi:hypothetical protein